MTVQLSEKTRDIERLRMVRLLVINKEQMRIQLLEMLVDGVVNNQTSVGELVVILQKQIANLRGGQTESVGKLP